MPETFLTKENLLTLSAAEFRHNFSQNPTDDDLTNHICIFQHKPKKSHDVERKYEYSDILTSKVPFILEAATILIRQGKASGLGLPFNAFPDRRNGLS